MAKKKLQRFAETATFPHFFQPSWEELQEGFSLRGQWLEAYFKNNHPLIIELGCGKGEYTVGLASKYPDRNFIGIDKKGARMWRGARNSLESNLPNTAFIRMLAENLDQVFAPGEVDEIWITFPEPQPNSPRVKKRFTSPQYLKRFGKILKPEGIIHLKTDNDEFYHFTLEVIREGNHRLLYDTSDLYSSGDDPEIRDVLPVQTHYEKIWLEQGLKIKYLKFKINPSAG